MPRKIPFCLVPDIKIIWVLTKLPRYGLGLQAAFTIPAEANPTPFAAQVNRPGAMGFCTVVAILIWISCCRPARGTLLKLFVARPAGSRLWAGRPREARSFHRRDQPVHRRMTGRDATPGGVGGRRAQQNLASPLTCRCRSGQDACGNSCGQRNDQMLHFSLPQSW